MPLILQCKSTDSSILSNWNNNHFDIFIFLCRHCHIAICCNDIIFFNASLEFQVLTRFLIVFMHHTFSFLRIDTETIVSREPLVFYSSLKSRWNIFLVNLNRTTNFTISRRTFLIFKVFWESLSLNFWNSQTNRKLSWILVIYSGLRNSLIFCLFFLLFWGPSWKSKSWLFQAWSWSCNSVGLGYRLFWLRCKLNFEHFLSIWIEILTFAVFVFHVCFS